MSLSDGVQAYICDVMRVSPALSTGSRIRGDSIMGKPSPCGVRDHLGILLIRLSCSTTKLSSSLFHPPLFCEKNLSRSVMYLAQLLTCLCLLLQDSFAMPWEHVILADCISSEFVRVSHMAYYSLGITSKPETVTVVPTPRNTTAVWANRNSTNSSFVEAIFPDGTYFRAALSTEKDFAGLGYNSFRSFNCWKYKVTHLYAWYSDVTCDAVYDCNHQAAAGDDKALNATTTSPTSGPPETIPAAPRLEDKDKRSNDIALGTGIGIGLPSVIVAIIGVLVARNRKNKQSSQPAEGTKNGAASTQAGIREPKKRSAPAATIPQGPTSLAHESTATTLKPTPVDQRSTA